MAQLGQCPSDPTTRVIQGSALPETSPIDRAMRTPFHRLAMSTSTLPPPADLRAIPLFSRMTDAHVKELDAVFERKTLKEGDVLFRAGDPATHLTILVRGEVALYEGDETEPKFRLSPPAPIGELGAITNVAHNVKAVATQVSEVVRAAVPKLMEFFERRGDVAFPFYHSLLTIVSDKVRRDEHRLDEMRANIIRTQKTMKKLRDLVLESPETELSEQLASHLDELIEHNRRGHYRVEPPKSFEASVRLDDGRKAAVREISEDQLFFAAAVGTPGKAWSGVLCLPGAEIPISGTVEKSGDARTLVKLDLLVDDYKRALVDYLTRVQMLDFVV